LRLVATIGSMIDPLQLLLSRRSIRRYDDRPIPPETIDRLLTAATWAPSAHNRQPWRFVVMTDGATKARLATAMGAQLRRDLANDGLPAEAIDRDAGRAYALADMDAYPDARRSAHETTMAVQSVAMAGQNLLLAAHVLGLGACWLCAPLFCAAVVHQTLDLPADWQPQGLVTLGHPAEERQKTRVPLETRVLYR